MTPRESALEHVRNALQELSLLLDDRADTGHIYAAQRRLHLAIAELEAGNVGAGERGAH